MAKNRRYSAVFAAAAVSLSLLTFTPTVATAADPGPTGALVTANAGSYKLTWDGVKGANGYRVEVSTNPEFTLVSESATVYSRNYVLRLNYGSSSARTLYWRVLANVTEDGFTPVPTDWTTGGTIAVPAVAAPGGAVPASGASFGYPSPVKFSWSHVPGANGYELEYAPGGDFNSSAKVTIPTEGVSYAPSTALTHGTWGWRVRARMEGPASETNYSQWTNNSTFTVNWDDAASAVNLLEPVPSGPTVPAVSDPVFKWAPVNGASYYEITVARDFAMSNKLIQPTKVYGTTYVPKGNLLNGEYYWTVVAYDAAGNPGFRPSSPQKFVKRWGMQSGPIQPAGTPDTTEAAPVPAANMGGTSSAAAQDMKWNEFELKWAPIPRASKYRVVVKTTNDPNPKVYSCTTPNTSATMIDSYSPGAQSPGLFKGDGTCFGYLPRFYNSNGAPVQVVYQWRVQGVDQSASGENYGQGELVSAESDPLYFRFTCDDSKICGGGGSPEFALDPSTRWANQSGDNDLNTAPAPLMTWAPVAGTCDVDNDIDPRPRQYEVRVYRGTGVSVHVATFTTYSTFLRPNGVFKDDNTGQSYYWRVRLICNGAYAGLDWDSRDSLGWTRTTNPTTVPSVFQESQNGAVLIKWTPQFDTGQRDGASAGYNLRYRLRGTSNWTEEKLEYPFWVPNSFDAPLPNGTYEFQVAPLDYNLDVGRYSNTNEFVVSPSVPTGLSVSPVGSTGFIASWTPSQVTEGYQIRYQPVGSSTWITPGDQGFTQQTTQVVSGLAPGSYNVAIRSKAKGDNWSQWTNSVSVTIASVSVTQTTAEGATLSVADRTLSWPSVAGASRYQVQISDAQGSVASANPIEVSGTSLTFTDANSLVYGKPYYWRVVAVSERGGLFVPRIVLGASSVRTFYVNTVPSAPTLTSVVSEGKGMRVSWNVLSGQGTGSSGPVSYQVRYRKNNQTPVAPWQYSTPTSGSAASLTIPEVEPGFDYYFQVSGINGEGQGPWSVGSATGSANVPPAPISLTATTVGDKYITLQWGIQGNGGSPLTGIKVKWKKSGAATWNEKTLPADATTSAINGLTPLTKYLVEVTALNAVGESPAATYEGTTVSLPSAPLKLKAVNTPEAIELSWVAPEKAGSSKIVDYVLESRSKFNGTFTDWATVTNGNFTSFVHYGIVTGTPMQYRVVARNSQGAGPYSSAVSITRGAPTKAKLSVTVSGGKFVAKPSGSKATVGMLKGYKIQWSLDKKKWSTFGSVAVGKSFTKSVGKKGKPVYFRAAGVGDYGAGPWSTVVMKKR